MTLIFGKIFNRIMVVIRRINHFSLISRQSSSHGDFGNFAVSTGKNSKSFRCFVLPVSCGYDKGSPRCFRMIPRFMDVNWMVKKMYPTYWYQVCETCNQREKVPVRVKNLHGKAGKVNLSETRKGIWIRIQGGNT
jgi:hypothetical protein